MLGSSLSQIVCRRSHVLLCVCVCLRTVMSKILLLLIFLVFCVVFFVLFAFVLCLVYLMLPVSLDCPFLISPSGYISFPDWNSKFNFEPTVVIWWSQVYNGDNQSFLMIMIPTVYMTNNLSWIVKNWQLGPLKNET